MDRVRRFVELLKTDYRFQIGAALVVAAVIAAYIASR
jgi:hypothetical protein